MQYKALKTLLFISLAFSSDFLEVSIDNISSKRVLSITQDSSGFIWVGTDEGLNRFDGVLNKIYRSNIFDDKTISGNRVWITYLDKNNTLWVGTDRGVCYYDKEKDIFHRIETRSKPIHVLETEESVYFTTSNNGVFKIIKKEKRVFNYQFDPLDPFSLSSSKFSEGQTKPLSVKDEFVWIGTTNGLNQINIKTGQTKRFYSGKSNFVKGDTITSVLVFKDSLYVGTTKGMGIYKNTLNKKNTEIEEKLNREHIVGLFEIKETGSIAAILKNKVVIFKNSKVVKEINTGATFKKVTNLQTGQYVLTSKEHKVGLFLIAEDSDLKHREIETPIKPTDLLIDKEGGVWMVGDEGLLRAAKTTNPVKTLKTKSTKTGKFNKTEKDLFLLTENSIVKYLENGETIEVSDLFKVKESKKIYVSEENNIFLYDKKIDRIDKNGKSNSSFSFNTPIDNVFSKGENLFISFKNNGIVHCNLKTNTITDYRKNRLLSETLPRGASSFHQRGTRLWLGNDESGLYELDIKTPENPRLIQHHTYDKNNPNSFSSSSVSCITEHAGMLFIGTSGDGFFIYNKNGFIRFSIQEGLPSNNIVSFTGSSDSTIWVLTNAGVSLVDWSKKNISNIGPQEGLKPFFKNQNSLFSKKEGTALLISPVGTQEINADNLYINKYEATVVIESVELIDKQNKKHKVNKANIKVNHTTPIIKVNLTTPSIYKADQTTFTYFVDNYHTDWVDNGARRYLELQGLKTGHQKVRIKSYNNDGYESINTAELKFQIIPPWWETWWAYLSYVLVIASGVFYYIKYQTKAQQKAAEDKRKEEELEEARQFQLDMLPRTTPNYLDLDISAAIQTASEVGGDYYDYFPQEDKNSLYVVVGDATGHGMTAGMMVSITKAGLYGIPAIPPNEIATRLNTVIKAIDLGLNRMAFNMARFWEDRVEFTSAAMPPAYHYRAKTKEVDEVLLGGLPLGSIKNETFSLEEFPFERGDSLVFISDGLPEATNKENEMLGYEAVFECVKSNGEKNAESQKQALLDLGTSWLGDLQNQDDITIVVVKKTISLD